MLFRIAVCLTVGLLTACSTAKMQRSPDLQIGFISHPVTEMPNPLTSRGDVAFGPYRATGISRGWVSGESSGWSVGDVKYEAGSVGQDYSYQFIGDRSWAGECRASKGQQQLSVIAYGFSVGLRCGFSPLDAEADRWEFNFTGDRSDRASGVIELGSKTVTVQPVDRMEGSPLRLGFNTGYYFYLDDDIVAAVDVISKQGPVWFDSSLSQPERDQIAMVAVAFLLNQVTFDN